MGAEAIYNMQKLEFGDGLDLIVESTLLCGSG